MECVCLRECRAKRLMAGALKGATSEAAPSLNPSYRELINSLLHKLAWAKFVVTHHKGPPG